MRNAFRELGLRAFARYGVDHVNIYYNVVFLVGTVLAVTVVLYLALCCGAGLTLGLRRAACSCSVQMA